MAAAADIPPLDMHSVLVYSTGAGATPEYHRADLALITKAWLQRKLNATLLDAVPCEEDHMTDEHYNPLFYIVVASDGYDRRLPRNWNIESVLPDTVAWHTRCPTPDNRDAYLGLHGNAVLLPKVLVPPDTLAWWREAWLRQAATSSSAVEVAYPTPDLDPDRGYDVW